MPAQRERRGRRAATLQTVTVTHTGDLVSSLLGVPGVAAAAVEPTDAGLSEREQEVLALAITNEEEDSRIYRGFAEGLREQFPSSAKVFDEMADEEKKAAPPPEKQCAQCLHWVDRGMLHCPWCGKALADKDRKR